MDADKLKRFCQLPILPHFDLTDKEQSFGFHFQSSFA